MRLTGRSFQFKLNHLEKYHKALFPCPKKEKVEATIKEGKTGMTTKRRLRLDLTPEVASTIAFYADKTGRSKTDFVRTAIGVYAHLVDETIEGRRVVILSEDGETAVKELLLPR